MEKTGNLNINSKSYWNIVYGDPAKRAEYTALTERGVHQVVGNMLLSPSVRIHTAVDQIHSGQKVLDIGCGVGIFTELVKAKFPDNEIWGVDISDTAIEDNKKKDPSIIYHQQYIGKLDQVPENYFDVVFAGEVLEHLDDPSLLLKDSFKALKVGGELILTTPLTTAINSNEHVWYFEKGDVKTLFEENGFSTPEFLDLPDLEYRVVIFAIGKKEKSTRYEKN